MHFKVASWKEKVFQTSSHLSQAEKKTRVSQNHHHFFASIIPSIFIFSKEGIFYSICKVKF